MWNEAQMRSALELLSRAAGLPADAAKLRAAARAPRDGSWLGALRQAAGELGVDVRTATVSLGELDMEALPIVTGDEDGWRAIVQVDGRRVRIASAAGASWTSAEELERDLGEPSAERVWMRPVPAAPLDTLRGAPTPLSRLRRLVGLERGDLWVIVVYAAVVGLVSLVIPIAVQTLVTTLAFGNMMQPIVVLMTLIAGALAFAGAMRAAHFGMVEVLRQRAFARAAMDVAHRMPRASAERVDRGAAQELANRFFDVVAVQKAAGTLLIDGLALALQTVIGMLVLGFYHPFLLAFDVALVVGIAVVLFVLGGGATDASVKMSKAKYSVAAWLEETARHAIAFKSPGGARFASERASDLVRDYLVKHRHRFSLVMRQYVGAIALQVFAFVALLGIGGWLVIQRQLTVGQLIAAELIVASVVDGFTKLGKHVETWYDLVAAVDKLGAIVDLPLERGAGAPAPRREGPASVSVRNVTYALGGRTLVDKVSLAIPPGARVGVLGPEGSGKTVLADLLWGLRSPTDGVIEVDGADTRETALDELRRGVHMVKGIEIFVGSVFDNVACGRAEIDRVEVAEALAAVGLTEAVERLPEGASTVLSASGAPLSSGQARRLMVARAIVGAPRLVVVDEVLDGMDRAGLERSVAALRSGPWTLIVLSREREITDRLDVRAVLKPELGLEEVA